MATHCTSVEPDAAPQHNSAAAPAAHAQLRLVLDTNAVLDWLLFRDKGFVPISAVIESGKAMALTNDVCLEELRRVLRYPEFKLDEVRQVELLAQYRCCAHIAESGDAVKHDEAEMPSGGLPICKDPDDQKFLELAWQQRAVLVTKDKLLLQLARRVDRGGRFQILRPDLLVERYLKFPGAASDSSC